MANTSGLEELKDIIEYPNYYIMKYFEDIKDKLDLYYASKDLQLTQVRGEETSKKEWIELVEMLKKCEEKCIKNKLSDEVINSVKSIIDKIKSNQNDLAIDILKLKNKLISHLLSNSQYLVVSIKNHKNENKILFVQEGFSPTEIENLLEWNIAIKDIEQNLNLGLISLKIAAVLEKILQTDSLGIQITLNYLEKAYADFCRLEYKWKNETDKYSNFDCFSFDKNCYSSFRGLISLTIRCRSKPLVLKENIFVGLDNLEHLDIRFCYLRTEAGCFNGLSKLKSLEASYTQISLTENIFATLKNLERLDLRGVLYPDFGCFNGLKKLKFLDLSKCNIKKLQNNIFNDLESLEELDLDQGETEIYGEEGCLNGLKKLRLLHLRFSRYGGIFKEPKEPNNYRIINKLWCICTNSSCPDREIYKPSYSSFL